MENESVNSGKRERNRAAWPASKAPARPPTGKVLVSTVSSTIALMILATITTLTGQQWLIAPMAASMALVVGAPQLPLSQPRNVIGGQTVSALVGVLIGLLGHSLWFAALAGGLALGAMILLRMPHSLAAATAVVAVSTGGSWPFVLLAAGAATILVIVGVVGNRVNNAPYPAYVW